MKKKIFGILCIGALIGVIGCWLAYEGLTRTSDDKFCIVCHEMTPMIISYRNDVHGGVGEVGFKAQCVDCHMPHDNIFNYIYTKAKNGIVEGKIHFFGNVDAIDWHKNRVERREKFVFDDGCIKCHENYQTLPKLSDTGKRMHEHYVKLKDSGDTISCASCHIETGHHGLNNMLNYFKPQYEIYEKEANATKNRLVEGLKKDL